MTTVRVADQAALAALVCRARAPVVGSGRRRCPAYTRTRRALVYLGEEKPELLSTCTLYALAISMSDQLKVGVVSQVLSRRSASSGWEPMAS